MNPIEIDGIMFNRPGPSDPHDTCKGCYFYEMDTMGGFIHECPDWAVQPCNGFIYVKSENQKNKL